MGRHIRPLLFDVLGGDFLADEKDEHETTTPYKFGLSIKDGDLDFDAAARTYDITEGISRGGLNQF